MEDLEEQVLDNLSNIELLKQLSDRLQDDSLTKRMKTTESLCKALEEYNQAGVLNLENSISEYLQRIYAQSVECALKGVSSGEEKFQAAWSLILLRLIKIQHTYSDVHTSSYFVTCVSNLFCNRSYKVIYYLIREYQDLAVAIVKTLTHVLNHNAVLTENILALLKSIPASEKIKKNCFFDQDLQVDVPKKRIRIENFDPEIPNDKLLVDTSSWDYKYKEAVAVLWQRIINSGLKEKEFKLYLKFIPKIAFAQVPEPLLFSDFFLKCYEMGSSPAMLALNGLFILSTKHGLESKLYYEKLYLLLKSLLGSGKSLKRGFLRLVELSLSSHLLPAGLIASFIRMLLREALRSPLHQTLWSLALALKCIKVHPALVQMLHNAKTEDLFNYEAADPFNTGALESSMWELNILKDHYHKAVRDLVAEFSKPIEKIPRISPGEIEMTVEETKLEFCAKEYIDFIN
jgi:U3 small nucleolar RNA-associated protein 19